MPIRERLLKLLQSVSRATGVPTASILGRSRHAKVARARAIFTWIAVEEQIQREQIGQFLRRDRSTISHALTEIKHYALHEASPYEVEVLLALFQTHNHCAIPGLPSPQVHPVHQVHPHLHQPTNPMTVPTAPAKHTLNVTHIAQAARDIQSVLDRFAADPLTTDLEALVLLRETSSHCMSHYSDIRTRRRMAGLEADPHNDNRGLESWIAMAETAAEAPTPKRTHPPRNIIPAAPAFA